MNRKTIATIAIGAAIGVKVVTNAQSRKKIEARKRQIAARNLRIYKEVLSDAAHTQRIVDRVLDGGYGTDFRSALRDITIQSEFERIVRHYDD